MDRLIRNHLLLKICTIVKPSLLNRQNMIPNNCLFKIFVILSIRRKFQFFLNHTVKKLFEPILDLAMIFLN